MTPDKPKTDENQALKKLDQNIKEEVIDIWNEKYEQNLNIDEEEAELIDLTISKKNEQQLGIFLVAKGEIESLRRVRDKWRDGYSNCFNKCEKQEKQIEELKKELKEDDEEVRIFLRSFLNVIRKAVTKQEHQDFAKMLNGLEELLPYFHNKLDKKLMEKEIQKIRKELK